ncbi:MAG: hypothetical protein OEY94_06410 [Alphaproteobacteria bacterium]|nr:hypothetical protein [Alphaproteobacteria bacterium]
MSEDSFSPSTFEWLYNNFMSLTESIVKGQYNKGNEYRNTTLLLLEELSKCTVDKGCAVSNELGATKLIGELGRKLYVEDILLKALDILAQRKGKEATNQIRDIGKEHPKYKTQVNDILLDRAINDMDDREHIKAVFEVLNVPDSFLCLVLHCLKN